MDEGRATLNPTTPYTSSAHNDIVGGNSGSPVINVKGELAGLIFEGNIQSLPGYFVTTAAVNRAVSWIRAAFSSVADGTGQLGRG